MKLTIFLLAAGFVLTAYLASQPAEAREAETCTLSSVRNDQAIPGVIFVEGKQSGVASLPRAGLKISLQLR